MGIQSKPIAIAAITIIECAFIGPLTIYTGYLNPLIVLWSITAMETLLFCVMYSIGHTSTHEQHQA